LPTVVKRITKFYSSEPEDEEPFQFPSDFSIFDQKTGNTNQMFVTTFGVNAIKIFTLAINDKGLVKQAADMFSFKATWL
jgi:hypothetical protein